MKRFSIPSLVILVAGLALPGPAKAALDQWQSWNAGDRPRGIAVGDVEGTGQADLIVANFGSPSFIGQPIPEGSQGTVQLFSPSAVGLRLKTTVTVGAGPRGVAYAPAGRRGGLVLVTLYGEDKLKAYRFESGQLIESQSVATGHQPVGVTVERLGNQSGYFAVVSDFGSSTVSIFPIDAEGRLGDRQSVATAAGPVESAVGDLNGDGTPEIAVACLPAQQVQILSRRGGSGLAPTYAVETTLSLPPSSDPSDLRIADLDQDGRNDLAVALFAGKALAVYTQNAARTLNPPLTAKASGSSVNGMAVGSLVRGEAPVVVLANRDSDVADIFRWSATGPVLVETLALSDGTDHSMGPVEAALLDVNLDGVLDLATTHMRTGTIRVVSLKDVPQVPTIAAIVPSGSGSTSAASVSPLEGHGTGQHARRQGTPGGATAAKAGQPDSNAIPPGDAHTPRRLHGHPQD